MLRSILNSRGRIALILLFLLLSSCLHKEQFPTLECWYISSAELQALDEFALSPDGERIIDASFYETELETGKRVRKFGPSEIAGLLHEWGGSGGLMGWSVDGRYLAATQMVLAPDSTIVDTPVVIIDTQTNTARYYKGSFNGWSAVNSERFLTNNWTPTNLDGTEITVHWGTVDFRKVDVKGNENFLWSVEKNLPIAYFRWFPVDKLHGTVSFVQEKRETS
jgi:hypothetical protein